MQHQEIRNKFINFFKEHEHQEIPATNLIAKEDPTLLLTNSGMAPLKPFFTGEKKPPHPRLTNIQRCVRTEDFENIGDPHHHTFFEMLGSWSIGDYGKEKAVALAWELLTSDKGFHLKPDRLFVTVFSGNDYIPADTETASFWKKAGVPEDHILKLPAEDNFWTSGPTGPCGPCTEVLYDRGEKYSCGPDCHPNCSCGRFYEIWNAGVFMEYNRLSETEYEKLPFRSVDTGAGLERLCCVLQEKENNYQTDLFFPLIEEIEKAIPSNNQIKEREKFTRIIADHLRASFFLCADGLTPSNKREGYILRRLIRRSVSLGKILDIDFLSLSEKIHKQMKKIYAEVYPQINQQKILSILKEEIQDFLKILEQGEKFFNEEIEKLPTDKKQIPGETSFNLEATYGLPLETQQILAQNKGVTLDKKGYLQSFTQHQEISRQGAEQKFGKVQEYPAEEIAPYHTTTHLLHEALRKLYGQEIKQAGQSLSPERLRFDFTLDRKPSKEEISQLEKIVNEQINREQEVKHYQTSFEEAIKKGAVGIFTEKYQKLDQVKVYQIGDFSKELCGGPHVQNTREIKDKGQFKITKSEGIGKGVRRIKGQLVK